MFILDTVVNRWINQKPNTYHIGQKCIVIMQEEFEHTKKGNQRPNTYHIGHK
jgi:hypothetical protein